MNVKNFAQEIINWFNKYGLKTYIILPVLMIIVFFTYDIKKIKNWNQLPNNQKRFLITTVFAEIIVIIGSMIILFKNTGDLTIEEIENTSSEIKIENKI